MKLSTVSTIQWVAIAIFWALSAGDWMTPGDAPAALKFVAHVSVYVFLSAQFYIMGAKRSAKNPATYEMSN